jgi:quercetin dioxygenase-like cupin family protein
MRRSLLLGAALCLSAAAAFAQDPVKVDPKHYSVVFENDQVRVLKIHYGAHEKSVMHTHPNSVVIPLTDMHAKFNLADGKSQDSNMKAGESMWTPATKHLPENTGDAAMDGILVELKGKPATHTAAKPAAPAKKPGS